MGFESDVIEDQFRKACTSGDLKEVQALIESGFESHIFNHEIILWTLEFSQLKVAEYLISKGANILNCLPEFLHYKLFTFWEAGDYGEQIDHFLMDNDNFCVVLNFMMSYGYPINIVTEDNGLLTKTPIGKSFIGYSELDLAIEFQHHSAAKFLREIGGKRAPELFHPAGNFLFTLNDKLILSCLVNYEKGDEILAFKQLKELMAQKIPVSKLIVVAFLNNYESMLDYFENKIPSEFYSYKRYFETYDKLSIAGFE